jgi:hypothetical protein
MITLGSGGEWMTVWLPIGAAFVSTLQSTTPWPAGFAVQLRFSDGLSNTAITWSATIGTDTATFNITKDQVQAAIAARLPLAHLYYIPSGADPLPWAHGIAVAA